MKYRIVPSEELELRHRSIRAEDYVLRAGDNGREKDCPMCCATPGCRQTRCSNSAHCPEHRLSTEEAMVERGATDLADLVRSALKEEL